MCKLHEIFRDKNSRVLSPKSEKPFSYCLGVAPDQHPISKIKLSVNKL